MAIVSTQQGFSPVLYNKDFRRLWAAQWLAQTAQNTTNFILIVLIERLTGATVHQGLMIIALTLPGVIFAPISGVIIDRWPKKNVLVYSNALRVVAVSCYLAVLFAYPGHSDAWLLLLIYTIAFVMATIGQFFNPAETAMIPFLVERQHLLAANSLFNLTLALSQVIGLIILGPLAVKLIGINKALVLVMAMYATAAVLVSRLPKDIPGKIHAGARGSWDRAKSELKEGAQFVIGRDTVLASMINLTLIASLVMIMAMLAPGIASRVFHLSPEDAIVVFAPAGIGMLVSAVILGRRGNRVHKQRVTRWGLVALSFGFAMFGLLAWRFETTNQRLALDPKSMMHMAPAGAALILTSVLLSLILGLSASGVNIVSQTVLQENTPDRLRGRVFSVQFMLNNLVGIPPMLAIGAMADWLGIPVVLVGVSMLVFAVLLVTTRIQRHAANQPLQESLAFSATSQDDMAGRPAASLPEDPHITESIIEPPALQLTSTPLTESR